MDFDKSAELFRALGDPGRLKVLALLAAPPSLACAPAAGAPAGSVCACDLTGYLGLSQPTVSHHMKLLVAAGLVSAVKRGRWTDYALAPGGLAQVQALLAELETAGTGLKELQATQPGAAEAS